ncbi:MAG: proline--tRNA ligase [Methanobacteriota archaeon]|nr:MAG: proline--tRNA ligase [Euryarchaeota archaeon]
MRKEEDFSEWYGSVIEKAELRDKRYPVKGMDVWLPYGWAVMKRIDHAWREEFDATAHREVNFPLLIPETEFEKEADHVKGFESDVYWVTHGGLNPLDVRLVLRPTSETAMYPMFALWIRSHADLPLKLYQIVSTFRYETKMTRTFLRVREIHFFEAHTAHATFEDAEQQIQEDLQIHERLMRRFCLPYLVSKRPDWDKFPGAFYSLGADTLLPSGRALQIATFHQYKDNFSKVYDVKYEHPSGEHRYAHQTTDGMSERLVGAIIAVHGDEKGLVLPPEVAPVQVVIVPILEKGRQGEIGRAARELFQNLQPQMRVHIDERDLRPGEKFYYWEARGVPLRVELGPKDLAKGEVVVVQRTNGVKRSLAVVGLAARLKSMLELIQVEMFGRADAAMKENIVAIARLDDARDGINKMGWCGREECGRAVTEKTGMSVLGTPYYKETASGKCIVCGEPAKEVLYAAKAY